MEFDLKKGSWINEPKKYSIGDAYLEMTTEGETDFWQRTYYGFQNDNAPAFQISLDSNFTFTVKAEFQYEQQFDQCGVVIYLDSENWFKASIEYENKEFSRLGSVVTNSGYSDWATSDIPTCGEIYYRLSRRGPDFLIESSLDGKKFKQMRIFHMSLLGNTSSEMGKTNDLTAKEEPVKMGVYACSPLKSSFKLRFDQFKLEECIWKAHEV